MRVVLSELCNLAHGKAEAARELSPTASMDVTPGLRGSLRRHTLAGSRTLSAHLDALLYHLIVSGHVFAVLCALLTELGT